MRISFRIPRQEKYIFIGIKKYKYQKFYLNLVITSWVQNIFNNFGLCPYGSPFKIILNFANICQSKKVMNKRPK